MMMRRWMSSSASADKQWRATTILCVRKGAQTVLIGDGQVSQGSMIVKPNARKVRKLAEGECRACHCTRADAGQASCADLRVAQPTR